MSYASIAELRDAAEHYGVTLPSGDAAKQRLLDRAARHVDQFLGATYDPLDPLLEPDQIQALKDGTVAQAAYLAAMGGESALGVDDGIASLGGVSFSVRQPARFSAEAAELLSGVGLFARSGTVEPDPLDAAP